MLACSTLGVQYTHSDSVHRAVLDSRIGWQCHISYQQAANGKRQRCSQARMGCRRVRCDLRCSGFLCGSFSTQHNTPFLRLASSSLAGCGRYNVIRSVLHTCISCKVVSRMPRILPLIQTFSRRMGFMELQLTLVEQQQASCIYTVYESAVSFRDASINFQREGVIGDP